MGSAEITLLGGLLLAAYAVYSFVSALLTNNSEKELLSWASGQEPVKSKSPFVNWSRPLVHNFTLQHALRLRNPAYRKRLERLIETAGLSRELNVDEFIGLQILWGGMLPLLIAIMKFALEIQFHWIFIVALIPAGFYGPTFYANAQKREREKRVRADLPFFSDLLALAVKAGSDLMSAIQKIVDKAENSVLADELAIVLKDMKLGSSREDALRGLARRLDIPEITSFVAVLVDATATGASMEQILRDQSEQIRMERFVRAEKAGARASQTMLIPLMFFILPAVFIVVFGPVAIQFLSGGK